MPTRRKFFGSCTALAVTVSIAPAVALSAPFRPRQIPLEEISFLDFAAKVNTRFAILGESRPMVELWLAQAKLLDPHGFAAANSGDDRNEKFSLLFAGDERAALPSDIYDFEHEGIGQFQMFITPVGPSRCYYEAVFNRPVAGSRRAGLAEFRTLRR